MSSSSTPSASRAGAHATGVRIAVHRDETRAREHSEAAEHLAELVARSRHATATTKADIRTSLLLVARDALLAERTYMTKSGPETYATPEYGHCIKAIAEVASLDGHVERTTGKGKQPEEQEGHEDVDQQLADYALSRPGLLKRIDERRGRRVQS